MTRSNDARLRDITVMQERDDILEKIRDNGFTEFGQKLAREYSAFIIEVVRLRETEKAGIERSMDDECDLVLMAPRIMKAVIEYCESDPLALFENQR